MSKIALKHQSKDDRRFSLDNTPITSPWRDYGRFNKYDESFPISAYELFTSGKTLRQVARSLGCSVTTMKRWMAEIEDFGEACELGITNQQASLEDKIQENMVANGETENLPEINTKLFEMYVKAQIPETYNEKYQVVEEENNPGNDGNAALFNLLEKTDSLKIVASVPQQKDGTPAQHISIEKSSDKKIPLDPVSIIIDHEEIQEEFDF